MKLFNDIDVENDIKFSKIRKTSTKTCIIDIKEEIYQTGWLKIISDIDNNICVDASSIKCLLEKIDNKIIDHSAHVLEFSIEDIKNMYIPIFKSSSKYFILPINSKTILFDGELIYDKEKIKYNLKSGDNARFIISFKKISFRDYELYVSIELHQIELN